jgi:hypothetical protein
VVVVEEEKGAKNKKELEIKGITEAKNKTGDK